MLHYEPKALGQGYTIKVADAADDLTGVLNLISQAHLEGPYANIPFEPGYVRDALAQTGEIDKKVLILLLYEGQIVGFLWAVISPSHLSSLMKIATELFWYVDYDHRGRYSLKLLEAFELWAKMQDCTHANVSNVFSLEKVERLYTKKGYVPVERSYMKAI